MPKLHVPIARIVAAVLALLTVVPLLVSSGPPAGAEPAGQAGAPTETFGQRPLRVASFNIHHGVGTDNLLDLERIARVIEDGGAQVVGLQEVDRHFGERSQFVDQATWLAERLGMRVVFGANLDLDPFTPDAPRRQYGTAILSRHRIRGWRNTLLPRPAGGEQRGLLEAVVSVRGARVRVFNTHLQHNSQEERLAQIAQIRTIVGQSRESVVLLGDLNATPESPEIAAITEDLADTWVAAGEGEGFTYDAETPHARIDYVLTSSDVVAKAAAVVTSDGSDHLPVVVDLVLPGGRFGRR